MTAVPEGFPKLDKQTRPWRRYPGRPFVAFMMKVDQDDSGCWLWQGALNNNGYPRLGDGYAHRWSYEAFRGPIPDGLDIDHLCRTPRCVNPLHLEPVTRAENIRRGTSIAAVRARLTHCPVGHPYDEANTSTDKRGWRKCRECKRGRDRAARRG